MKRLLPVLLVVLLLCGCGAAAKSWQEEYDLGVRYLSEGNYEEAILAFEAAIEIDPKAPGAYLALANAYVGQGDYENAGSVLTRALESVEDPAAIQARLTILEGERDGEAFPGVRAEASYDEQGDLSQIDWYDAAGVLIRRDFYAMYLEEGCVCERVEWYDAEGNVIRKEEYTPEGILYQLEYYDEDGNLTHENYYQDTGIIWQRWTEYESGEFSDSIVSFDDEGRMKSVQWNDWNNVAVRSEWYDAAGNLIRVMDDRTGE